MDHQNPDQNTTASSSVTPIESESESPVVNEVLLVFVDFAEPHYSDGQQVSTERIIMFGRQARLIEDCEPDSTK